MIRCEVTPMKLGTKTLACAIGVACLAASPLHAADSGSDWQFAATIYGWFPDIGGHTEFANGAGSTIDVDVSSILDHLKMTAQGSFEFHKGRWGGFTDIVYLDVGDSNSRTRNLEIGGVPIPATVTTAADFDLKSTFWTLAANYWVIDSDATTFGVMFGARLAHMNEELKWTFSGNFGQVTPPPLTGSAGESVDQWDGIVGVQGRVRFGADHKWAMPYYFDIGAGDSDLTWQAEVALTYSFGWGDIGAAWRYLDYDLDSNGPIKDLNFNGPAAGVTFRW
jgi:hypothetical protein